MLEIQVLTWGHTHKCGEVKPLTNFSKNYIILYKHKIKNFMFIKKNIHL